MYYLFKLSGSLVANNSVVEKLMQISRENDITVVHGCGEQFSERLDELGISYKRENYGKRQTSAEAIKILPGIVCEVNHGLAKKLGRFKNFSEIPIGIKAEKFPVDYRGKPTGTRFSDYRNCVVGSLGVDVNGVLLNVDADDVAECIARSAEYGYDRIIYVTKEQNTHGRSSKNAISRRVKMEIMDESVFTNLF